MPHRNGKLVKTQLKCCVIWAVFFRYPVIMLHRTDESQHTLHGRPLRQVVCQQVQRRKKHKEPRALSRFIGIVACSWQRSGSMSRLVPQATNARFDARRILPCERNSRKRKAYEGGGGVLWQSTDHDMKKKRRTLRRKSLRCRVCLPWPFCCCYVLRALAKVSNAWSQNLEEWFGHT